MVFQIPLLIVLNLFIFHEIRAQAFSNHHTDEADEKQKSPVLVPFLRVFLPLLVLAGFIYTAVASDTLRQEICVARLVFRTLKQRLASLPDL